MKKYTYLLIAVIFIWGCSEKKAEPKIPPLFKNSIPENNATDVSIASVVEVTFDEVVTLAASHGVTVNGDPADVSVLLTKMTFVITLEKDAQYSVFIPKGAVINTKGVPLAEDIEISFSTEETLLIEIDENLVTPDPSPEAVNLYHFLRNNYGAKCLSAVHANVSWNINEAEWVKQHTNVFPAMTTVDYIHLPASPANWIDYNQTGFIEDWWSNNGLLCANWHWIVPRYEGDTETNSYTYKPNETSFKASNILIEGTWENSYAKADLEELAGYLKLLQAKNIPVIWRPLHEAAGNIYEYQNGKAWFWWGDSGAETYKALWTFIFDYFQEQGLDNLIWVWTTQTKDNAFFPGDEYVDIIGRDIYNNTGASDIAAQFAGIQEAYPNKMVTLSEMGSVSNISDQWSAGSTWSYFMPWYDYERTNNLNDADFSGTDHQHANAGWWLDAMNQDYVITRDQMPDLK